MKRAENIKIVISLFCSIWILFQAQAQELKKKVTLTGTARSVFLLDDMNVTDSIVDTTTVRGANSGHALVDLNANIRPNENMEILGSVRIRNDFGGFWGSGVTFDVRQLYLKGIIAKKFRYQVGDLNYKMSPFTLYNSDQELFENTPSVFSQQREMLVMYDNFYSEDNYWRQQGAAADFTLTFKKFIKSVKTDLFTSRIAATDFNGQNDRLFSGATVTTTIVDKKVVAFNAASTYDLDGTSRNEDLFRNPVYTGSWDMMWTVNDFEVGTRGELGASQMYYVNDTLAPDLNDYFYNVNAIVEYKPYGLTLELGIQDVGPDFFSAGAQTKRVQFNNAPLAFANITNDKIIRNIGMIDLLRDGSIYNLQLTNQLMPFSILYDNITPYGMATPNRTGFNTKLKYKSPKEYWTGNLAFYMLEEIRGEGTDELRSFNRMKAGASVNIHKIAGLKRALVVNGSYRMDQTNRSGGEFVRDVDFKTDVVNFEISWTCLEDLDVLAGFTTLTGSGVEFQSERNGYNQLVDFTEYEADVSEQMIGLGLRYRLTENAFLSGNWMRYTYEDKELVYPEYEIDNFSILFNIKF